RRGGDRSGRLSRSGYPGARGRPPEPPGASDVTRPHARRQTARGMTDLAGRLRRRFGWEGPAPAGHRRALIIPSGLPGTGKSYVAAEIRARHPAAVVRTDEVRKALFPQPTYGGEESGVVYRTCYALIASLLRDGYTVIFDGTNTTRDGRRRARTIA